MSGPRRLLEDGASEFERNLLSSARGDQPPPGAKDAARAALPAASGASIAGSSAVKFGVGAAVSGGAAVLVATLLLGSPSDPRPQVSPTSVAPAEPTPGTDEPTEPSVGVDASSAETEPFVGADPTSAEPMPRTKPAKLPRPSQATPTNRRVAPVVAPAKGDDLRAQIALIDRAKRALRAGAHDDCQTALAEYRQFSNPLFGPEASALEVRLLFAKNDRPGAHARLGRFRAEYPDSPLLPGLEALLASE